MSARKFIQLCLLVFCLTLAPCVTNAAPPGNPSGWIMTFSDEFDGTSLDLSKWDTKYAWGGRTNNDELEWYVDNAHIVSGGTLKLVAKHETVQSGYPYTSGIISGHKSFNQMYGYFEISMKLPSGQGLWPAFWLMPIPSNWPPEIDVMENLGQDTHMIYLTNHYSANYPDPGSPKGGSNGTGHSGPDYSAGFHTYGVEWSQGAIVWYIDGVEQGRVTQYVPVARSNFTGMYVIANLAVGGSWPGSPNASTEFPCQLEIDWIRIWQKGTSPINPPASPPATPKGLRTTQQ
jgi:beta-glucanase (GH16 family)